jgi:hypothetical protein
MARDGAPLIRYGAMYALGLGYCGTGNNAALRQLLHVAVSDVSDDVRRAAVTNIGFVLCRSPAEVPVVVSQLAESYNAHVRYGATMALGLACAGTGMPEAVGVLEPMLADTTDFVRQGALLALGLVLQEESEAHLPKAKAIRDKLLALSTDKHQSTMTKMGAIMALGIMDAGGRNAVVSLMYVPFVVAWRLIFCRALLLPQGTSRLPPDRAAPALALLRRTINQLCCCEPQRVRTQSFFNCNLKRGGPGAARRGAARSCGMGSLRWPWAGGGTHHCFVHAACAHARTTRRATTNTAAAARATGSRRWRPWWAWPCGCSTGTGSRCCTSCRWP